MKTKNDVGASLFSERLESLIDGDVTCWGIDDAVAYGIKVSAMERDSCATVVFLTRLEAEADDAPDHGIGNWLRDLEESIRERSNVELRGCALLRSPA